MIDARARVATAIAKSFREHIDAAVIEHFTELRVMLGEDREAARKEIRRAWDDANADVRQRMRDAMARANERAVCPTCGR